MANPYKEQAASTAKSKFGSMKQPQSLAKHADSGESKAEIKKVTKGYDLKAPGYASGGRLDRFARGGRTKGKTTINIDLGQKDQAPPMPVPMPMPAPPPPAAAGPPPPPPMPPAPPGGMMPPAPVPSPMTGMPPPMPPPAPGMGAPGAPGMPKFRNGGKVSMYIGGKPSEGGLRRWARYARANSYTKG